MNHATAAKAPKLFLSERFGAFWLFTKSKLAQIGKHRAQSVKLECILLDDLIRLTTKSGGFEIISMLDNVLRHPLHQLAVIFLQNALCAIELVLWCAHGKRARCLTLELTHAGPKDVAREAELRRPSGVVCSDFVRPHY
jgi:hypothetical protein